MVGLVRDARRCGYFVKEVAYSWGFELLFEGAAKFSGSENEIDQCFKLAGKVSNHAFRTFMRVNGITDADLKANIKAAQRCGPSRQVCSKHANQGRKIRSKRSLRPISYDPIDDGDLWIYDGAGDAI